MGGQSHAAHILYFERGYVVMMFGSFSLIVSPSLPPCLVPQLPPQLSHPQRQRGERQQVVMVAGLPLACAPVHSLHLPRSSVPTLCPWRRRLREEEHVAQGHTGCRNSTGTQQALPRISLSRVTLGREGKDLKAGEDCVPASH